MTIKPSMNRMNRKSYQGFPTLCLTIACAAASIASAAGTSLPAAGVNAASPARARAIASFEAAHQNTRLSLTQDGAISRVYGRAFSTGATGAASAQSFIAQSAGIWGVSAAELVPEGPFADKHHTQPIGYLPDVDAYKFTGYYYSQVKDGLPVFRTKLILLVRNQENNPLVLASSQLHDLSGFQVNDQLKRLPINQDTILDSVRKSFDKGADVFITDTERVVYAGTDTSPHEPTLADVSNIVVGGFEKYLIVTDAITGAVLYKESLIHTLDITGNASGMATDGIASDQCEDEILTPLPYLYVSAGGATAITDINGDYDLAHPGVVPISVGATLTGRWFEIHNYLGSVPTESINITPPGPADIVFNQANSSEYVRAQVNAYVQANVVRDYAIAANPAYPLLQNEQFPVYVNRTDGYCPGNAWYDPSDQSLNLCTSASGYPNTAWGSVIHHEYGHHLVNAGGSGQDQYGEGMGDVMGVIIDDDPRLGLGFFGNCSDSLRNADNNLDYPCNGEGHSCAPLISGCVWETRQALVVTEPDDYTEILNYLAVNAILVHSGSTITPQITIDWLTLDDDDSDIGNGTPHYTEIDAGFSAHNMDAPPLTLVDISFPSMRPDYVSPNGTTILSVDFEDVAGTLDPSSPTLMVDIGSGFSPYPMTQVSGGNYQASFPASDCGSEVNYYVVANDLSSGLPQYAPASAPATAYTAIAAFDAPVVSFEDNFEADLGWAVSGDASGRSTGRWERGTPAGNGSRGDAPDDFDGSGQCFVTGNGNGGSDTDVDGGSTILTSPVMDASGASVIHYARWYDNTGSGTGAAPGADVFVVEISDNAGASWTNLETVGPNNSETMGGWNAKQFTLASVPGFDANNQFMIRFTASDNGSGSVIEAAVDAISLEAFDCDVCPADISADGDLNFFDISEFLTLFSAQSGAADFDGNGEYNFFDISAFLSAFSAGCP